MEQTILVTGSTSGFGRLTVETLARQGYRVFASMRAMTGKNAPAAEALHAFAQQEQLDLRVVEIDVTDDASVEQATATMMIIPCTACCISGEMPSKTIPFPRTAIINTPTSVFRAPPEPPLREVPPTTTAVIVENSRPSPIVAFP